MNEKNEKIEKYETPEVEFVDMEENDVVCASTCPAGYGNVCVRGHYE